MSVSLTLGVEVADNSAAILGIGSDHVSDLPFGFQPPRDDGDGSGGPAPAAQPQDPFAMFGGGQADLSAALHRFADLMSWSGGPVNWDLARDVATEAAGESDPMVGPAQTQAVSEALRLADLWLDDVTPLPTGIRTTEAWSRKRWVQATLPVWSTLADPVAARVVDALSALSAPGGQLAESMPPEMASMSGALGGMFRQIGGAMFGSQVGQALGMLGHRGGRLDRDRPAARPGRRGSAAAHQRRGVRRGHRRARGRGPALPRAARGCAPPAVRPRAVAALAPARRSSRSTPAASPSTCPRSSRRSPSSTRATPRRCKVPCPAAFSSRRPRRLRRRRSSGSRPRSPWSRAGSTRSSTPRPRPICPEPQRLRETTRRRRAAGGPAEQAFATLVGLELRPRRLRDAAALWAAARRGARHRRSRRRLGPPRPDARHGGPRRPGRLRRGRDRAARPVLARRARRVAGAHRALRGRALRAARRGRWRLDLTAYRLTALPSPSA